MTSLEYLIAEVLKPFKLYVDNNWKYVQFEEYEAKLALEAEQAAIAAKAAETVAASVEENTAETTSADNIEPPPAAVAINASAVVTDANQLGTLTYYKMKAESAARNTLPFGCKFTTNFSLAADKARAAKVFIEDIESLSGKPVSFEPEKLKPRLIELRAKVKTAIDFEATLLGKHKEDPSVCDALFSVAAGVLDVMIEKHVPALSIALQYESYDYASNNYKANVSTKSKQSDSKPALFKVMELVSFLTKQMIELHLDRLRAKESTKLGLERKLDDKYSDPTISKIDFVITRQIQPQNIAFVDPVIRLNNASTTIESLLTACGDINDRFKKDQLKPIPTTNAFLEELLSELRNYQKHFAEKLSSHEQDQIVEKRAGVSTRLNVS
jgi:hypothetical protein